MTTETQTIDVTGLPPDAVRAVQAVVAALRGRPAPPAYDPTANWPGPPPGETAEEWSARWRAWVKMASVPGVIADDSRESIYDRSTE